ncbi:hypothetical protein [uncultured Pseudacidovorax sp.]|uniref:hypothetical protein n=1 Tax=uncultured Pseudacidovorax sp. TaxID=679313 RepID=UPI0025DC573D|nr:hypothetical protein [uncultured Pseudacidovorax sp.]
MTEIVAESPAGASDGRRSQSSASIPNPEINHRAFDCYTRVGLACSVIADVVALRRSPLLPAALLAIDAARIAGEKACETPTPSPQALTQFAQLTRAADTMLNAVAEQVDDDSVWCATFEMHVAADAMTEVEALGPGPATQASPPEVISDGPSPLPAMLRPLVSKLADLVHHAYELRASDVGRNDPTGANRILEDVDGTLFGMVSAPNSDLVWRDPGMTMLPVLCLARDQLERAQALGVSQQTTLPLAIQLTTRLIEVVSPVEDAAKLAAAEACSRQLEDGTLASTAQARPVCCRAGEAALGHVPTIGREDTPSNHVHCLLSEAHAIMFGRVDDLEVNEGEALYAAAFLAETALSHLAKAMRCSEAEKGMQHLEDCDLFMNRVEVILGLLNTVELGDVVLHGAARLVGLARLEMDKALDEAIARRRAVSHAEETAHA